MKKQAFTLVELIVVITILAILGTIGFINLQGFSSSSRDSKRISELSEIRNGLQIYQARNGILPTPSEQSVTIGSGSTDLIIQGYVGESVLNEIRMNGNPKDPLDDNKYYIYSVNANKTKFQLLSLLENDDNLTSFIVPTTHASYTNRHLYVLGQNVGILLDETTNTPINQLQSGRIDLSTDATNYKAIFLDTKNPKILSGSNLHQEIITKSRGLTGWRALDPYCDIDDIIIGDQVWAGCNSRFGSGTEWGYFSDGQLNSLSYCWDYSFYSLEGYTSGIVSQDCVGDNKEMESISKESNWNNAQGKNGVQNTIWGKMYTQGQNFEGVCPTGWSIPTFEQFQTLTTHLNGGNLCLDSEVSQDICPGLGWSENYLKNSTNNLIQALKIPLSGLKNHVEGYSHRGYLGVLLVQSTDTTRGLEVKADTTSLRMVTRGGYGMLIGSVRCIRE